MCAGGGGGGGGIKSTAPHPDQYDEESGTFKNREDMKVDPIKDQGYSEGTLGGGGMSRSGSGGRASYWKSNPTWDQQWYDKGYKKGDFVSSGKKQSDKY